MSCGKCHVTCYTRIPAFIGLSNDTLDFVLERTNIWVVGGYTVLSQGERGQCQVVSDHVTCYLRIPAFFRLSDDTLDLDFVL